MHAPAKGGEVSRWLKSAVGVDRRAGTEPVLKLKIEQVSRDRMLVEQVSRDRMLVRPRLVKGSMASVST